MLAIKPNCENCNKELKPDSTEAMICSYECTFCSSCVESILHNVCPNCGGGLEKRPVRPKNELINNPASKKVIYKPIDLSAFKLLKDKFKNIEPHKR